MDSGGRVNPYSAEIDFRRHNMTSVDVILCGLKSRTVRVDIFTMAVDP